MEDKLKRTIEFKIELYEDFVNRNKEELKNVKSEWLKGFYEGKLRAYEFALEDFKRLLREVQDE